ncbi:MAG: carbohydrate kinase family protein [Abditibacteriota bacterium]|nr:carbohydrate kinase family protein [Abditibacteriota bacterium]
MGKISVMGAAIIDVLAAPVNFDKLSVGSLPMEDITLSYGGDALNEAVVLAKMGAEVELFSTVGDDEAGERIVNYLSSLGVDTRGISRKPDVPTGINMVLVDDKGERYFLTNPHGSLRKLTEDDLTPYTDTGSDIVSFAGIFVSPLLDIPAMTRLFAAIKKRPGRVLAADMTKAKKGETLSDLTPALRYIDYIFPNEAEAALLTGRDDPYENARLLTEAGVGCAVIKRGKEGCLIRKDGEYIELPAFPGVKALDSTGAGDTFAAGFIYALSRGFSLRDCGLFANAAASVAVEYPGATEKFPGIEKVRERYEDLKRLSGY